MNAKSLSWDDIVAAAASLGVNPYAMSAVWDVESNGNGFLPSGRPKILFEGHVFWRELDKLKKDNPDLDPAILQAGHPRILYPKWSDSHGKYLGGEREYERLEEAKDIHEDAALASASWGAFQIMGFNYALCGYARVRDFADAQCLSAAAQLEAFSRFIKANGLMRHLQSLDWAKFAHGYNGPSYADNKYDDKLKSAYENCLLNHPEIGTA